MDVYYQVKTGYRLLYQLEYVTFHIGFPVVRMGVRSRDYHNFLDAQITKFSYPWCSAESASRAQGLCYKKAFTHRLKSVLLLKVSKPDFPVFQN